jgi:hypothetical protein
MSTLTRQGADRPIGYWLKQVDQLLDASFDAALAESGMSRRDWQVLSSVVEAPKTQDDLEQMLAPFVEVDPTAVALAIDDLLARGWVRVGAEGEVAATAEGLQGHSLTGADVDRVRLALLSQISEDEYVHTIDVLRRMAAGLAEGRG